MKFLIKAIISIIISITFFTYPTYAARDTDSYDGNIYPIYAGNGSLVPPQSSLRDSISKGRTSVIIYYLDDSSDSKEFAPVVSGIKLLWTSSIDLIPLTIDELKKSKSIDPMEESYYWNGTIPQVVIINGEGEVILNEDGQVPIENINKAISKATGLKEPSFTIKIKSFNEYNSEPSKDGYTDPRIKAKSNSRSKT